MAAVQDESYPPNKSHHVGEPRTHFRNPWPSFRENAGPLQLLKTRFSSERNFVPVPETREELVGIQEPDWGATVDPDSEKLKATWIGHASWLVETPASKHPQDSNTNKEGQTSDKRGIRILTDPVFSERTSPFTFLGPKRYTPTPCSISDLPEIDVVAISHNHYDHLDSETIKELAARSSRTHFLCALGVKEFFTSSGVDAERVTELDWWQAVDLSVRDVGIMRFVCTPAQHFSARWINDKGRTLWCSWAMGSMHSPSASAEPEAEQEHGSEVSVKAVDFPQSAEKMQPNYLQQPRLYFAGDTGYRAVDTVDPTPEEAAKFPHCPAFSTIGTLLGPFDLALLPIGLFKPRNFMSPVHCAPEDSVCVAKDIEAKKSIGMHYGTVRGGLSGQYEDVREPPRRWKESCEKAGLKWGEEAGLCDVGETVTA